MANSGKNPLDTLINRELSSVEFVRDYVQLRFDGPRLTVVVDPLLEIVDKEYSRDNFGFCDILCGFIGYRVEQTSLNEESAILRFEEGRTIKISLNPNDPKLDEAIIFDAEDGQTWIW